jgi:hypothetical protein
MHGSFLESSEDMGIVHEHSIDWNPYKRHRILLLCLVVFFIPLARLVGYLEVRLNLPSAVMAVFVVAWILFICWAGGRFALWPCKNCGKSFRGMSPLLPEHCAHCGALR